MDSNCNNPTTWQHDQIVKTFAGDEAREVIKNVIEAHGKYMGK